MPALVKNPQETTPDAVVNRAASRNSTDLSPAEEESTGTPFNEPGWEGIEDRAYGSGGENEGCPGKEACLTPAMGEKISAAFAPIIEMLVQNSAPEGSLKDDLDNDIAYNNKRFHYESYFKEWQRNIQSNYTLLQLTGSNQYFDMSPDADTKGSMKGWVEKKEVLSRDRKYQADPATILQQDVGSLCKCCFELAPLELDDIVPLFVPQAATSIMDWVPQDGGARDPNYEKASNAFGRVEFESALRDALSSPIENQIEYQNKWMAEQTRLREDALRNQYKKILQLNTTQTEYNDWVNSLNTERPDPRVDEDRDGEYDPPTEPSDYENEISLHGRWGYATLNEVKEFREWLKNHEAFGIYLDGDAESGIFRRKAAPEPDPQTITEKFPESNEELDPMINSTAGKPKDMMVLHEERMQYQQHELEMSQFADQLNQMLDPNVEDNIEIWKIHELKAKWLVQMSGELINRQKWDNFFTGAQSADWDNDPVYKEWKAAGLVKDQAKIKPIVNGSDLRIRSFVQKTENSVYASDMETGKYGYADKKHHRNYGRTGTKYDMNNTNMGRFDLPEFLTWMVDYKVTLKGEPGKGCD